MGADLLRRALVVALVAPATAVVAVPAPSYADPDPGLGCGTAEVTRTLTSGSAWRLCARIDPVKGLVLEQVQFRPATAGDDGAWLPVIDSLYLAQLVVPYDSGSWAFNDVTDYGFGDYQLLAQDEALCAGETLPVEQAFLLGEQLVERTIPGICVTEASTGLGWASHESHDSAADQYVQEGRALTVSSMTKISWYEYQQQVTLTDQGTITVGLGATGDLAPSEEFFPEDDPATGWPVGSGPADVEHDATSHWHNAVYRVDFGIGTGDQQVEQWDYAQPDPLQPGRVEGTATTRTEAFSADADADPQTWWRVLNPTSLNADGHPRSYEIVNDAIQDPYDPLTRPQVSFTNDHACQEYASANLNAGCPGLAVPDYVAEETGPLVDPVAWVNVGFHHVARDEDQSPMPTHWQEFSLVPRDLVAQQATTPPERSCVNGGPVTVNGSCAAVNLVPPQITTEATTPTVGTELRTDRGVWRIARSALAFQVQWRRDGVPIVGSTSLRHTVTEADLGHRISVRIRATGYGVLPGTATSADLLVPLAPAPPSSTPVPRTAPVLGLALPRHGRPRLVVRVRGTSGAGTGTVVVRGPGGWSRTRTLGRGRVVVPLPRALAGSRKRLVARYRGDTHYLPGQRAIRLR